jgi:hydroxymethylpyrimidine pyrophosphatase-like HAD family hydrolase
MIVNTGWIFDIDGVVTNPSKKKVSEPQILVHIANKLKNGEPVAFNTGRSTSWLIERVINPLLEMIEDKNVLQNFIAVSEKGGCWVTFDKDGTMQEHKDDSISVPESLRQQVKKLIDENYADSMFYDDSKQTMISTEMNDGLSIEEYKKDQNKLTVQLKKLLQQNNFSDKLKIDPTTIATDIENIHVGKDFATERILELLKKKGIKPKQFIAFGDSPSDIEMAEKLHERNLSFTFIFVDDKGELKGREHPFPIVYTKSRFDQGTLEFLREHSGGV